MNKSYMILPLLASWYTCALPSSTPNRLRGKTVIKKGGGGRLNLEEKKVLKFRRIIGLLALIQFVFSKETFVKNRHTYIITQWWYGQAFLINYLCIQTDPLERIWRSVCCLIIKCCQASFQSLTPTQNTASDQLNSVRLYKHVQDQTSFGSPEDIVWFQVHKRMS